VLNKRASSGIMKFFDSLFIKFKSSVGGGLSKYTLLQTISKGTTATVYLAIDEKGQKYAVKILSQKTAEVRKKINSMRNNLTEGELAMTFDHPNIIKTFEWGMDSKGEYIVTELIEGIVLQNLVGSDAPEIKNNAIKLTIEMGSALSYIHKKGYIHRDFCPRNIFLTRDNRIVVFNFGWTISIKAAGLTHAHRAGTASYMAPELIKRAKTDERTDIYSFGVIIYEMLTGAKPFGGSGTVEQMIQLLNAQPKNPREINPDIPEEIAQLILKCLEKKPDKRFRSVDKILKLLDLYKSNKRA